MHFLLDANMPRSAIDAIRAGGHECTHIRDTELANAADAAIAERARSHGLTLITRDFDFADIRHYPPEHYDGIVILDIPESTDAF